tara:strand:+ start:431 stop:706 length:276 start_codon:yes stop_codon:yes gene_type:complete
MSCEKCNGTKTVTSYCHQTNRIEYDDCWDCISDEMYEYDLKTKLMKRLSSEPSKELLALASKLIVGKLLVGGEMHRDDENMVWELLREMNE